MSDFLFDVPEQLSPKQRWLKKHGIKTHFAPHMEDAPWSAWLPKNDDNGLPKDPESCGYGASMESAIVDLARRHGMLTWQESSMKGESK